MGALANQLPLKLGRGGEQATHEPPLGRGGVDGISERTQAHAPKLQLRHHVQQMLQGAAQPVEFV